MVKASGDTPADAALAFSVHGYGPRRMLALHGLFSDGTSFEALLAGIDPAEWTLICLDLRGFGRSAALGGPYTLTMAAEDAQGDLT